MNPRARRQNQAFKQRVMQLMDDGKFLEAWNLLTDYGWTPKGSGYQEHYPHGLSIYAKIHPDKEILRSSSGRLWAWKVSTPEEADRLEGFIQRMRLLSLPEIAETINGLEGSSWWIMHDFADGRIAGDINDDLRRIRELVRLAAEVFAEKTGISYEQYETLRERIQQELKNYDEMLRQRWQTLFKIGTVFRIIGGGRFRDDIKALFEVVDIFDLRGYLHAEQLILVREQGTGVFTTFMDTDVAELLPVEASSIYSQDNTGFLRTAIGGQFFDDCPGLDVREAGTVFEYRLGKNDPRNGVWETFFCYWRVNGNEVVIARSHDQSLVAEFEGNDLPFIMRSMSPRKFIKKGDRFTEIPILDLNDQVS